MTFRDDHDAALARADALEDEVERTKRERDELAAKVKELEQKPKQVKIRPASTSILPDDPDRNDRTSTIWGIAATAVVALLMIGFFAVRSCNHSKAVAAWAVKRDARTLAIKRWAALVSVEECVRRVAIASGMTRENAKVDPRVLLAKGYSLVHPIANDCGKCAAMLIGTTPRPASDAIASWIQLQDKLDAPTRALADYFSQRDYVEDNFAGATGLWKPVRALLDRQAKAMERLRTDAFPAIRSELRALIAEHEATTGRDVTYWRSTLALLHWECNDLAFAAGGLYAGRKPDFAAASTAMRPKAVAFIQALPGAPIEVRRDARSAGFSIASVADGQELPETDAWYDLFGALTYDESRWVGIGTSDKYIAALPPDPGPRPEEPGGDL